MRKEILRIEMGPFTLGLPRYFFVLESNLKLVSGTSILKTCILNIRGIVGNLT